MTRSRQWLRLGFVLQVFLTAWARGDFYTVKDVLPVPDGWPLSGVRVDAYGKSVFSTGDTVFFPADDGVQGTQIWRSDGTDSGTRAVTDSLQLSQFFPSLFYQSGTLPFFTQDTTPQRHRIIVCDGTAAGSGYIPLPPDFSAELKGAAGPLAFFLRQEAASASYALWATNATATSLTKIAVDVSMAVEGTTLGKLFFVSKAPDQSARLWASDGTTGGTSELAELPEWVANPSEQNFLAGPTGLYFIRSLPTTGAELWHSDGTAAGTRLLKDIHPGTLSSKIQFYNAGTSGELLFFQAGTAEGRFLWRSDGTSDGTIPLQLLSDPETQGTARLSDLQAMDGRLYYMWSLDTATFPYRLYTSDGTAAGTAVLDGITPAMARSNYTPRLMTGGGKLILAVSLNGIIELWKTDRTAAGPSLILSKPAQFFQVGKVGMIGFSLLFHMNTDAEGNELWRTDGTSGGTHLVKEINPARVPWLSAWNGQVFLTKNQIAIRKTDGTPGVSSPAASWETSVISGQHTEFSGAEYYVKSAYPEPGYDLRSNRGSAATDRRVSLLGDVYGPGVSPWSMVTAGNLLFLSWGTRRISVASKACGAATAPQPAPTS